MRRPEGDLLVRVYIRDDFILRFVGFITPFTGDWPFTTRSKGRRRVKIGRMSDVRKLHWVYHLLIVILPPVSHKDQHNKGDDVGSAPENPATTVSGVG